MKAQLRRRPESAETLTYRDLQERREIIREPHRRARADREPPPASPRSPARPDRRPPMRLVDRPLLGRTTSVGSTAHLPMATRLIMVKADGCVAIHADGGAYKPLNWMNAPEPPGRGATALGR